LVYAKEERRKKASRRYQTAVRDFRKTKENMEHNEVSGS
jgi:hypothetical protein